MNATLIRLSSDGLLHIVREDKTSFIAEILQDNILKVREKFSQLINQTEYDLFKIPTKDNISTFKLIGKPIIPKKSIFDPYESKGGGGGGISGINVDQNGVLVVTKARTFNFIGAGVTVTDAGGGIADITIPGGMGGSGTLNRIAKFTPDGSHIGDSLLFDNGTTVQMGGVGAIPSAQFAMTSTTQGILTPRMTTVQRNAIAAPATGLLVYNTSTTLFSYWDGATWQNIDSQAGGDVSGSGTTNFIPRWTDGPNSVLGDSIIRDNGTTAAVNRAVIAASAFSIQSNGTTSATYALQTFNSTPTEIFSVRSDGYILAGIANGSMTIGLGAGYVPGVIGNTFIGVSAGTALTTGIQNVALGTEALIATNTGERNTAIGWQTMHGNTTGIRNVAVGTEGLFSNSTGGLNTAIGFEALYANTTATQNTGLGYQALVSTNTGQFNTAVGSLSMVLNTTGGNNTAVGKESLYTNSTGSGSVALGYNAGYYETVGNKLFIDNTSRANEQDGRNKALIYGKFNAAVANQVLVLNGVLYMQDTAAPNHYWTIVNTAGAFVFADTGSANAPA